MLLRFTLKETPLLADHALLMRRSDIHGIIWYKVPCNRLLGCITLPAGSSVVR